MSIEDAAQAYVDGMQRDRGYVLDYHRIMAKYDFPVLEAANKLVQEVYLAPRLLSPQTKELLFILSLTVMRADITHIQAHVRVALELGVSPEEILEAIEIALPEAGVVTFQHGARAWAEVVGAQGLVPELTRNDEGSERKFEDREIG